jgi:hypothetical protein
MYKMAQQCFLCLYSSYNLFSNNVRTKMYSLSILLILVLILSCCVPSYTYQISSQIVDQLFMTSPNESQYRFPLFPSDIPFGVSSFSNSTDVLISFSQHQCLAIATGACRRLAAISVCMSKPKTITTTKRTKLLNSIRAYSSPEVRKI